jgi:NAD(P)-dependent dehydrogenase (short-subunit alcohol dehydrogenase family)
MRLSAMPRWAAAVTSTASLAAYVTGSAGIIGLTKVAALDYADQGIRAAANRPAWAADV